MPLIIPSTLPANDPSATIYTSKAKAYRDDSEFKKSCDDKTLQLIYEYQQQEQIKLMDALKLVPKKFHSLPFHKWIHQNTPVHALTEQAHEILWHKRLIHLSLQSIQNAHNFVDGILNLSK